MKVKEIMTADTLQYCSPETKLHNAAKIMKNANCGALPVVDKNKKVVGMVTDRDICLTLANKPDKPHAKLNVGDIISHEVYTVNAENDLKTALRQMRTNRIGRLPVVDQEGKLQGVLSMHDLLSKTLMKKDNFGKVDATGENIMKTIKALSDRYTMNMRRNVKAVPVDRGDLWEDAF